VPSNRLIAAITVVLLLASGLPAGTAVASHGDGADCTFPLTATDGTDTSVSIDEEPQRVVVIGASAAQTIWEIGAQDKVVAIDSYATYLEGAGDLPTVAGFQNVDYEAALEQNPDLVIVDGNSYQDSVATEFRKANVTTYKLADAGSLEGIVSKTQTAGHLLGACEGADETAAWMQERIDVVEETAAGQSAPSLFYDLGAVQDAPSRYSAGNGTFTNSLIETAGVSNIAAGDQFGPWPQVSNEFILEQNPEWLLVTYSPGFGSAESARQAVNDSDVLSQTAAAENGNVVAVNTNYLSQPAPRIIYPLQALAEAVHPEAYAAANQTTQPTATATATEMATQTQTATATGTATATATETASATDTATATDGGSSGGVPGFGAGVALVALAGAALLAGRRDQ